MDVESAIEIAEAIAGGPSSSEGTAQRATPTDKLLIAALAAILFLVYKNL